MNWGDDQLPGLAETDCGSTVVMSYGMGVDSTAILLRWLADPSSRDFDLQDLVVAALGHARIPPRLFRRGVVARSYLVTHGASKQMHPRL